MTDKKRRSLVAALGAAPFVVPLLAKAQALDAPSKFKVIDSRERIRQRYFPNLVLTTQEGKKVKFYDDLVKDKIVVFNMFYAKCEGICSPVTRNLVRVQNLLGDRAGKDIFFYSFSLKPKEDTVPALKHYAEMHKVKPGWLFLTGSADDMELLRRKLGFVDPDPALDKDTSNHIGVLKYGNEPLQRWGGCPGMQAPDAIAEAISWVDWPKDSAKMKANGGAK
ncbi:MAG TPA: SCO family protein [Pyrinomonadaceae bacterium]|nr:SCO family protein [Pyrinomonadaceae bacterium]